MTTFDEQPDGDPHGECAAEIARLNAEVARLKSELACAWQNNHILERERQRLDGIVRAT